MTFSLLHFPKPRQAELLSEVRNIFPLKPTNISLVAGTHQHSPRFVPASQGQCEVRFVHPMDKII